MPQPTFEEWSATWDAKHPEFDADKAKKLIYNLETERDRIKGEKSEVSKERDELKGKVDEAEKANLTENQRLQRELDEARKNPPKAVDKLQVILDRGTEKNLSVAQIKAAARYVSGDTAEEIEANFDQYVTDHNLGGDGKNGDGPSRQPKKDTKLVTGVDEVDNDLSDDGHFKDPGKALEAFRASR
jgi:hypothetical protein